MESQIPEQVQRFIAVHIRSLEQLEILLMLASSPDREWSVDEAYNVIRSSRSSVAERLDELCLQGLLVSAEDPRRYRFKPSLPEAGTVIDALAREYKDRRVKIVEMIYSEASGPLRGFADAFKLRKDQ